MFAADSADVRRVFLYDDLININNDDWVHWGRVKVTDAMFIQREARMLTKELPDLAGIELILMHQKPTSPQELVNCWDNSANLTAAIGRERNLTVYHGNSIISTP